MGFIDDLVSDALQIVKGVDSTLTDSISYNYHLTPPVYDTATGLTTEDLSPIVIDSVRTTLSSQEAVNLNGNPDLELLSTDRVYLVAGKDLGREPAVGDVIKIGSPVTRWEVVGWKSVPGDSLYKVVCRRP